MNIEDIRDYCLSKPATTESFPFDEVTLVFKVINKIFALTSLDKELSINLKCDPEKSIELREQYPYVLPGYHMNKKHWNTILLNEHIPSSLTYSWIDHSYNLIVYRLTKKEKEILNENRNEENRI